MSFGPTGYVPETLQDIVQKMSADATSVNPNLDPTENALMGILIGLMSVQLEQQYQHINEGVSSIDPDTAEGKALDVIAYRNGLIRKTGEADTQLRQRIKRFLSAGGNSTVNAMYAQLSNIEGVTDINIVENESRDEVPREGAGGPPSIANMPPHCFEVAIEGGDNTEIAHVIRLTKPAGIQAFGETSLPLVDTQGTTRVIGFTRADEIPIHLKVTYSIYDEEVFPAGGENTIADAIIKFSETEYVLGKDVILQRFVGIVHGAVKGVQQVDVEVSTDGAIFVSTDLTLATFEKAMLEKVNISFIKE
jgi:hypothetical protein